MQLHLNDLDVKINIDNLKISLSNSGYGVFKQSFPKHCHGKDYYEIHLIVNGKGTLLTDEGEFSLEKGSAFVTGPCVCHEQLTDKNDFMEEYCIGFYVKKRETDEESRLVREFTAKSFWIGTDDDNVLLKLFSDLEIESINRHIGYMENIKSLIAGIIVQLVRLYTDHMHGVACPRPTPDDRRMIVSDTWFIYEKENRSLENLAAHLNLSPRQTQRFLKKQYGKSFSELKKMRQE